MTAAATRRVPWFLWPFAALWSLVTGILQLCGRIVAAVLGLILMVAGGLLALTVVGAVVGIPLAILGFMLMLRSVL
jgi:hypothetical protein